MESKLVNTNWDLYTKTLWDLYVETTHVLGHHGYMPGSLFCPHGCEAGKDCDICYEIWKETKDKPVNENNTSIQI